MAIVCLHHASLLVADVQQSLHFYCDVLGLVADASRPDLGYPGAWLTVGAQQVHLLQLPNTHQVNPELHGGRDFHIAFQVTALAAIQEALDAIDTPYTMSRSGRKALFCRDPDGNALEFMQILSM